MVRWPRSGRSLPSSMAGYDEVVLAGCPLTGSYAYFRSGWEVYAEHLAGRVRSMSGWTKEFLEGLCLW